MFTTNTIEPRDLKTYKYTQILEDGVYKSSPKSICPNERSQFERLKHYVEVSGENYDKKTTLIFKKENDEKTISNLQNSLINLRNSHAHVHEDKPHSGEFPYYEFPDINAKLVLSIRIAIFELIGQEITPEKEKEITMLFDCAKNENKN